MTSELVTTRHLGCKAVIYIRQSTPQQVLSNQESLRLQYALRHRAQELGWCDADIEVIDADLGRSGATSTQREGFKDLIARVTLGEVGIILGLPHIWGSSGGSDRRVPVIGGLEALPEAGAERAIVDGAADLQQPIGAAPRPAHLLRFAHPAVHQEVGRALGQRRTDPLSGSVPFAVVHQPIALADEIVV